MTTNANTTVLCKFLKDNCLPYNDVEIQPGTATDFGFDPRLSETEYYGLYGYFFYGNEWVERIFDHYRLIDKDYGTELIRINEDGFRTRVTRQDLVVGTLKFSGKSSSTDYFLRVSRQLPSDARLLKNDYLRADFYDDSIQKFAVDEVTLKMSDTHYILLIKKTNLKTMQQLFSMRIKLKVTPVTTCAHYQAHVISAHTLKQILHEIELLLKSIKQDPNPSTRTYKSVSREAYQKNERDDSYTLSIKSNLAA